MYIYKKNPNFRWRDWLWDEEGSKPDNFVSSALRLGQHVCLYRILQGLRSATYILSCRQNHLICRQH